MKKLSFLFFCLTAACLSYAQPNETIKAYIAKYKDLAVAEMQRTGVPASITLAQGIHETGAGTSQLVLASNNHFGIKCKSEWKGESVSHDDDAKGECFRKYSDPADSYRDHSDFLKNRPFYASLFNLDPLDYEAWAYGLKKAGYATNPKYPQILIKLIRDYNLQDYSLVALNKKSSGATTWTSSSLKTESEANAKAELPVEKALVKKQYPSGIFQINDTKVIYVEKGTSFLRLADEFNISLSRLFEFNEMKPQDIASDDLLIFLQRKRKTGANAFHVVAPGETVADIAQTEGIRKESLLEYNHLSDGMQPAAGEKLYLGTKAPSIPKLLGIK
jgi:hypothetical protein